jgi:preprotein translocase subunit YajC
MNSLLLLSSPILASAENTEAPGFLQSLLGGPFMMVLVIMFMMYWLWIRPEQKRAKEHREMVRRVKAGDRIVTTTGIHGTVREVSESTIKAEVAKDVVIEIDRAAIGKLLSGQAETEKK